MLRTLSCDRMPATRLRFSLLAPARALMMAFAAVAEGLAACGTYQRSRRRGKSHDAAIREAFGIGPARQHGVGAIYFAGKA